MGLLMYLLCTLCAAFVTIKWFVFVCTRTAFINYQFRAAHPVKVATMVVT